MRALFISFFLGAFVLIETSEKTSSKASSASSATSSSYASSVTKAPVLYDGPCPQITAVTLNYSKVSIKIFFLNPGPITC